MDKELEVGQVLEGRVEDISHEGKAVVKKDGFIIFSDEGVIDDLIEIELIKIKKNFAIGRTLAILEKSSNRVEAVCPVADQCGGCQLQELDYSEELRFKEAMLRNNLIKIGGLEEVEVMETLGMDSPFRYRNNVQIPIGHRDGEVVIGHYEKKSHRVVDTRECFIQDEIADQIVEVFRKFVRKNGLTSYNKKTNKGLFKHIVIRTSLKTKDTMVIFVTNEKKIPRKDQLIKALNEIEGVKSIYQNMNFGRNKLTMTGENKLLYGEEYIIDQIGDIEYRISPGSFFQVNTQQAEVLYKKIEEFADLKGDEVVIDLYSGIGTISLYLADKVKYVYGVESFESSVEDAKENKKLNGIENASFFLGKAEDILPQLKTGDTHGELIILDPPRSGCEEELLETILEMEPEKIIYVSCNPSTLARDLEVLTEESYRLVKVQPVDMFPQTVHVECIALIQKKTI